MTKKILLVLGFLGWYANPAWAEIYKKVDKNGHVTYSNVPIKGAVKLNLEPPISTNDAPTASGTRPKRARTPTPANFPRVDKATQSKRDDKRRQILLDELQTEKKALVDAQQAYTEGKAVPEVYKAPDGATRRNVPKYEEKMQRLQAAVKAHEKNVELLQKELDSLN